MILDLPHLPGPEFRHRDTPYLYFGGTAYLGMQHLPAFRTLLANAIMEHGTHWGASRAGNIRLEVYKAAEDRLAVLTGAGAALTLSSGYLAARLVAEHFHSEPYQCYFAPSCHAALLLPGSHRQPTWASLKEAVTEGMVVNPGKTPVVFADTLEYADRPRRLEEALEGFPVGDCILVADDSHGLGLQGSNGFGCYQSLVALGAKEVVVCGSMGKALGISAGMVAGQGWRMDALRDSELFTGASPAAPANLAAFCKALDCGLYHQQRVRLGELMTRMTTPGSLPELIRHIPGLPVYTFRAPELAHWLFNHHILVTHFEYAADGPEASPSRIVLTAAHSPAHLQQLLGTIRTYSGA